MIFKSPLWSRRSFRIGCAALGAGCVFVAGSLRGAEAPVGVCAPVDESQWTDLFATGDFSSWTRVDGKPVGAPWRIEDGVIHRVGLSSGDIVTRASFADFELTFEWKVSEGGNSGVKYRTRGSLGLEYQVLDDERHRDGKDPTHRAGSVYDLFAARDDKPIRPPGEWNSGRIVASGNRIEHWLNGALVAEAGIGTAEWKTRFTESKYRRHEGFGTWTGPVLLQDHHDSVWYRNVRIRRIGGATGGDS